MVTVVRNSYFSMFISLIDFRSRWEERRTVALALNKMLLFEELYSTIKQQLDRKEIN